MRDDLLIWLIGAATAAPFVLLYWIGRFVARRRQGAALRAPRTWQAATLERWAEHGWLTPDWAKALPPQLSPSLMFYEWASVDPDAVPHWSFRQTVRPETPLEDLATDAWNCLPEAVRAASRERLAEAVRTTGVWWGGVERGWNRRPLALLAASVPKKLAALPLLPMQDLTAAPARGPLDAEALSREGEGPDLLLALAALRRWEGTFTHPLAPREENGGSLIQGLSTQVGTDIGRRVGAGIGAVLGPIGSLIGQHLGGMVGALGGQAVAGQMLPEPVAAALKETETALAQLGALAAQPEFEAGVRRPAEVVLAQGRQMEQARATRSRRFRERIWPTPGLALIEEGMRLALAELQGYRAAADHFQKTARGAAGPVAGGMILQNPWLVRELPGGAERLNAARTALNQAAGTIRRTGGRSGG